MNVNKPCFDSLPPPPCGKSEWPWVQESSGPDNNDVLNLSVLPLITIITPSYNQASFLEQTIRSVLLQRYPNLEYIVIDGGSTDGSLEIIKKYGDFLSFWISEKDNGQAQAINKGLSRAQGDIIAYINSDDYYAPHALEKIAQSSIEHAEADLFYGRCRYVDIYGNIIGDHYGSISSLEEILDVWDIWWKGRQFVQPEVFWRRRVTDKIGPFREDLHKIMDYDYWCRILSAGYRTMRIDSHIANFRINPLQKSEKKDEVVREFLKLLHQYLWDNRTPLFSKARFKLQGKWLYQALFLKQVEESISNMEPKLKRWVRLCPTVLFHPKIFLAPHLRQRIRTVIEGPRKSSLS